MPNNSTPLTFFHPAIRAIIDVEDHENPSAYKITEKIKVILDSGDIPGYKTSADNSSVEPTLTPQVDQKSYVLLVKKSALMFRRMLTKDQVCTLEIEVHNLENGSGFSVF